MTSIGVNQCKCLCFESFIGAKCETCGLDETSCNLGTINSTSCSCSCPANWKGERCSWCGLTNTTCGVNQVVNPQTCQCECLPPWNGPNCLTCPLTCLAGSLNNSTCKCDCDKGCNSTNDCLVSPGICNTSTGQCTWTNKPLGAACDDKDLCTGISLCNGNATCVTVEASRKICTLLSQCHDVGTCNPATGLCSNPVEVGASCTDGNWCTSNDICYGNASCRGALIDPGCVNNGSALLLLTSRTTPIFATQSAWLSLRFRALAQVSDVNVSITNYPLINGYTSDYTFGYVSYPSGKQATQPFKGTGIDYLSNDYVAFKLNPPQNQAVQDITVNIQVEYFWNDRNAKDTIFLSAVVPVLPSSGYFTVLSEMSPLVSLEVGGSVWIPINLKALSRLTNFRVSFILYLTSRPRYQVMGFKSAILQMANILHLLRTASSTLETPILQPSKLNFLQVLHLDS